MIVIEIVKRSYILVVKRIKERERVENRNAVGHDFAEHLMPIRKKDNMTHQTLVKCRGVMLVRMKDALKQYEEENMPVVRLPRMETPEIGVP